MKTYIFTWEDGSTSSESFKDEESLNAYLESTREDEYRFGKVVKFEPEDGLGFE